MARQAPRARATAGGRWGMVVLLTVLLALAAVPVAEPRAATVFYVGNESGRPLTGTDATGCTDMANTTCTLRGALSVAVAGDTVRFGTAIPATPVVTTITLTDGGGGTVVLNRSVTIDGTGKAVAISGGCVECEPGGTPVGGVQVLQVNADVTVSLIALTITAGNTGINVGGGGIQSFGTLSLTGVTVRYNRGLRAGGVSAEGPLTVTGSKF